MKTHQQRWNFRGFRVRPITRRNALRSDRFYVLRNRKKLCRRRAPRNRPCDRSAVFLFYSAERRIVRHRKTAVFRRTGQCHGGPSKKRHCFRRTGKGFRHRHSGNSRSVQFYSGGNPASLFASNGCLMLRTLVSRSVFSDPLPHCLTIFTEDLEAVRRDKRRSRTHSITWIASRCHASCFGRNCPHPPFHLGTHMGVPNIFPIFRDLNHFFRRDNARNRIIVTCQRQLA